MALDGETRFAPVRQAASPAVQEFPEALPSVLSAETVSLESLVHHRGSVEQGMALEEVSKVFREQRADFLAMLREGRVTGICSRVRLGSLLGSRYGFALYSRSPAHLVQVEHRGSVMAPNDRPQFIHMR